MRAKQNQAIVLDKGSEMRNMVCTATPVPNDYNDLDKDKKTKGRTASKKLKKMGFRRNVKKRFVKTGEREHWYKNLESTATDERFYVTSRIYVTILNGEFIKAQLMIAGMDKDLPKVGSLKAVKKTNEMVVGD